MTVPLDTTTRAVDYLTQNIRAVPRVTQGSNGNAQADEIDDEIAHLKNDLDLDKIYLHILGDAKDKKRGANIKDMVIDAVFEESIDATPTFTLVLHDPDWVLLNSGALEHQIDVKVNERRWYRLDGIEVDDDEITLTFITRNAKYLMYHNKRHRWSRGAHTRAEFIQMMRNQVKVTRIPFYCPELHKVQPIAKADEEKTPKNQKSDSKSKSQSNSDRDQGVSHATVKGQGANDEQLQNINTILRIGANRGFFGDGLVAGIAVAIVESGISNHPKPPNPPYKGIFQQNPAYWPATETAAGDAPAFWDALKKTKDNWPEQTDWGLLTERSQGAVNQQYPQKIHKVWDEAKKIVSLWMGNDDGVDFKNTTVTVAYAKRYEFDSDPDEKGENYLSATYRLATDVNWASYWVRDALHLIDYERLFRAKSRMRFFKGQEGVEHINFQWNNSAPKGLQTMTLQVRMDRWLCPVGTVATFGQHGEAGGIAPHDGGPARGRWLVSNIKRSMFEQLGTVTLIKPLRKKKEPAHQIGDKTVGNADDGATYADAHGMLAYEVIDKIVIPQARKILGKSATYGTTVAGVDAANARHKTLTTSGNKSDHKGPKWFAWAADMSNTGKGNFDRTAPTKEMDALAQKLADMFHISWNGSGIGEATDSRFRYQMLYRTDAGGGHWNHVHFGVKLVHGAPNMFDPTSQRTTTGAPGTTDPRIDRGGPPVIPSPKPDPPKHKAAPVEDQQKGSKER